MKLGPNILTKASRLWWNWGISNVTFGICSSGFQGGGRPSRLTSRVLDQGRCRAWGRGGRRGGRRWGGGRGRACRRWGRGGGRRGGGGREKGTTAVDSSLSKTQSQTSISCTLLLGGRNTGTGWRKLSASELNLKRLIWELFCSTDLVQCWLGSHFLDAGRASCSAVGIGFVGILKNKT